MIMCRPCQKLLRLSLHYSLPDEPTDAEPERLNLAIKLLDGTRHERWFRPTDTLGAVIAFAASVTKDELPPCLICTNEVPRRVFDNFSLSLSQAGINSRTVVYLEDLVPLDNNGKYLNPSCNNSETLSIQPPKGDGNLVIFLR